jgi:protein-arginine kinase activator protein McsA
MNQEDHQENEAKLVVQLLCDKKKLSMSVCRLCGEERSQLDLVVELNDIASGDWSYIKLIEDLKLEKFLRS